MLSERGPFGSARSDSAFRAPSVGIEVDHAREMAPDMEVTGATQKCAPERRDRITVGNGFVAAPIGITGAAGAAHR